MQEGRTEATAFARLTDDTVHLPVDTDASVTWPLERLLGEPVVSVSSPQDLNETVAELWKLRLGDITPTQPYQVDEEIARRK